MPSSYSTNLRLEKQANGENDTTWGTKMNTVIDLIEAAIAGRASVTHDNAASYTLTTANSSADEARNMILNIGGALTAARNTVVPSVAQAHIIKNATTGGYGTTVKTSAGTGILVPNGKTTLLYSDGTNVLSAIDYLDSLTVGGDLAIDGGDLTTSATTFNLLATPTTLNIGAGASVALNIGHASAAAAFAGGISVPTGKNVTGAGTAAITGFASVTATKHITSTSGLAGVLNNTLTQVDSLPNVAGSGLYLVQVNIGSQGDATNYGAAAIVITDGATSRVAAQYNGANMNIDISGLSVRTTQTSGSTQTVGTVITRLA